MAEESVAGEIALLRSALSGLEAHLETLEAWRALRQLDERERNGNPLQGIDGVSFRGRLVQGLAQSSREWRAYVRIEEAIGHLQGPARPGQGILKETPAFELPPQQAAGPELAAPNGPAPAQPLGAIPEAEPPDAQRLRVKVRAGSLPVVLPPIPIGAILSPPGPWGDGNDVLPAIAALSPRPREPAPTPGEPRPAVAPLDAGADLRSPRSVLQRIRLVSKDGDAARSRAPASNAAMPIGTAGDRLPTTPAELPGMVFADLKPATLQPAQTATGRGSDHPESLSAAAVDAAREQRLDALETELGQLIDKSASWPHPLDARRGPLGSPGNNRATTALEPDTAIELDVDEAEVTIVRLAAPEAAPAAPAAAPWQPRRPASVVRPPDPPANGAQSDGPQSYEPRSTSPETDDRLDGEQLAAHHLDLEEASVEIIFPDRPAPVEAGDGMAGTRRDPKTGRGNPAE